MSSPVIAFTSPPGPGSGPEPIQTLGLPESASTNASRRPSAIELGELSEDTQRLKSELQSLFLDSRRESSASVLSIATGTSSLPGGGGSEGEECNSNSSTHNHLSPVATEIRNQTTTSNNKSSPTGIKLQVLETLVN